MKLRDDIGHYHDLNRTTPMAVVLKGEEGRVGLASGKGTSYLEWAHFFLELGRFQQGSLP